MLKERKWSFSVVSPHEAAASSLLFLLMRTQREARSKKKSLVKNYQCQLADLEFKARERFPEVYSWRGAARKYWLSISRSTHTLWCGAQQRTHASSGVLRSIFFHPSSSLLQRNECHCEMERKPPAVSDRKRLSHNFWFYFQESCKQQTWGRRPGLYTLYSTGQSISGYAALHSRKHTPNYHIHQSRKTMLRTRSSARNSRHFCSRLNFLIHLVLMEIYLAKKWGPCQQQGEVIILGPNFYLGH